MKIVNHSIILLLLLLAGCRAEDDKKDPLQDIPDPKSLNESYVSDKDGILSQETVQYLNPLLSRLDQSGRAHIDVVLVKSIGDIVPKDAANQLFNLWKIGDKEKDNGLLIFLVMDQRRMEFETGYGLEGDLPDITCYNIQQQYMVPHARNGDYDAAVKSGVEAVIKELEPSQAQGIMGSGGVSDTAINQPGTTNIMSEGDSAVSIYDSSNETAATEIPYYDDGMEAVHLKTIGMLVVYLILLLIMNYKLNKGRYKYILLNPGFILMLLVPIALIAYIHTTQDASKINMYELGVIYCSFLVWLHIHFFNARASIARKTKDDNRYQKYVEFHAVHNRFGWTGWFFPLPGLAIYWYTYFKMMNRLRNTPYVCQQCGTAMQKVSEKNDDAFLEKGQQDEEKVKSVDYDVWECSFFKEHQPLIFNYKNLNTKAIICPACNYLTLMKNGSEVMEAATTSSSGWGYKYRKCSSCNHETKERYTIAKISSSSSSSGSSGGSSSSSGGSSGGGGAGSSW